MPPKEEENDDGNFDRSLYLAEVFIGRGDQVGWWPVPHK